MRQTPWKEASLSQEKKVAVLKVSRLLSGVLRNSRNKTQARGSWVQG